MTIIARNSQEFKFNPKSGLWPLKSRNKGPRLRASQSLIQKIVTTPLLMKILLNLEHIHETIFFWVVWGNNYLQFSLFYFITKRSLPFCCSILEEI